MTFRAVKQRGTGSNVVTHVADSAGFYPIFYRIPRNDLHQTVIMGE